MRRVGRQQDAGHVSAPPRSLLVCRIVLHCRSLHSKQLSKQASIASNCMSWAALEKVESRVRHFGGVSAFPVQNAALVPVYVEHKRLCLGALSRRPKNALKIIKIGLSGTKKSPAAREMKEALRAGRASRAPLIYSSHVASKCCSYSDLDHTADCSLPNCTASD